MGKHARFAHARELGNRANGQAFKADMGGQIERCLDNRGLGLLTFGERSARRPAAAASTALLGLTAACAWACSLRDFALVFGPPPRCPERPAMRRIPACGRSGRTGNGDEAMKLSIKRTFVLFCTVSGRFESIKGKYLAFPARTFADSAASIRNKKRRQS
jgi:hypothetical protein